jgi:hypothetical protein
MWIFLNLNESFVENSFFLGIEIKNFKIKQLFDNEMPHPKRYYGTKVKACVRRS